MNNNDPATSEALRWLRFSKADLFMIVKAMSDPHPSPHHACGYGRESVEKALKASLILEGISFPHTHDLNELKRLLPKKWKVRDAHKDMSELSAWAIDSMYPGASPEPTDADAAAAESKAYAVYDSVADEFKRRGIHIP